MHYWLDRSRLLAKYRPIAIDVPARRCFFFQTAPLHICRNFDTIHSSSRCPSIYVQLYCKCVNYQDRRITILQPNQYRTIPVTDIVRVRLQLQRDVDWIPNCRSPQMLYELCNGDRNTILPCTALWGRTCGLLHGGVRIMNQTLFIIRPSKYSKYNVFGRGPLLITVSISK
jgi:hypothetical protein